MSNVINLSVVILAIVMFFSLFAKYQGLTLRAHHRKLTIRKPSITWMTSLDTKLESGRISAKDVSLDTLLINQNPDLVKSHLQARRTDADFVSKTLQNISDLRIKRNALIVESDKYKATKKGLSTEIGKLMKEKKLGEVEALKLQVQELNNKIEKSDHQLSEYDKSIHNLFSFLPNLLDDR
jgi:hypothetical protein